MAEIKRMRVLLTGGAVVGPSVMTLYWSAGALGMPASVNDWLSSMVGNFPNTLTFEIPNTGDTLDDATGELTGTWTDGVAHTVNGTGALGYLQGTGIRVQWATGGIVGGRRVNGSTFLVPLAAGDFDTTGRLKPESYTALDTSLQNFYTAVGTNLVIWSRPRLADATKSPPVAARAGSSWPVFSAKVNTAVSTLRSRRT